MAFVQEEFLSGGDVAGYRGFGSRQIQEVDETGDGIELIRGQIECRHTFRWSSFLDQIAQFLG